MILAFNYNDFLLRPHRADEFDEREGRRHRVQSGRSSDRDGPAAAAALCAAYARTWAPSMARAVRPVTARRFSILKMAPQLRSCSAPTTFSTATSCITGSRKAAPSKEPDRHGKTREAFLARASDVEAHRGARLTAGGCFRPSNPICRTSDLIVATCERGDLRLSPSGILVHGTHGTCEVAVPRGPGRPGQGDALDALWEAARKGRRCVHDARWGRATVEIILAILRSSKSHQEVRLSPTSPRLDSRSSSRQIT